MCELYLLTSSSYFIFRLTMSPAVPPHPYNILFIASDLAWQYAAVQCPMYAGGSPGSSDLLTPHHALPHTSSHLIPSSSSPHPPLIPAGVRRDRRGGDNIPIRPHPHRRATVTQALTDLLRPAQAARIRAGSPAGEVQHFST